MKLAVQSKLNATVALVRETPVVFCDLRFFLVKADHLPRQAPDGKTLKPLMQSRSDEVEATCTGVATEVQAACTGADDGTNTNTACALNAAEDACNVEGDDCVFVAATALASCTGDNDGAGTGTACTLNAAGDACSVLEDGNNCVFVAATTPVCDLDASTDGTAACPAGCTTLGCAASVRNTRL